MTLTLMARTRGPDDSNDQWQAGLNFSNCAVLEGWFFRNIAAFRTGMRGYRDFPGQGG